MGKDCSSRGCFEVLNDKGKIRATKLANWFKNNGVVDRITHIFASHKPRTSLTVAPVAKLANTQLLIHSPEVQSSHCIKLHLFVLL